MWNALAILLVFVSGAIGAGTAGATSFEPRNFDALTTEAEQVVIGTVNAKNSRRTGDREIVTDFRFDDLEIVKGTVVGSSLTVTMLGGTVGEESLTVAGAPTFQRGFRYLVFISGNGSVMFPLVGGHQGIFQMRKHAASGGSKVHDYSGRPVARTTGRAGASLLPAASAEEAMTQAEFVDAIRFKLAGERK